MTDQNTTPTTLTEIERLAAVSLVRAARQWLQLSPGGLEAVAAALAEASEVEVTVASLKGSGSIRISAKTFDAAGEPVALLGSCELIFDPAAPGLH